MQKKAAAVEKERAMAAASSTVFERPETASLYNAALSGDDPTKVRCPCCEAKGIPQKFQPYQVVKVVDGVQTKVCPFGEGAPLESLSPSQWLFITGMVHREGKKEQPWYARLEKFLNQKVEMDPGFKTQIQELRQRRWQDKGKGGGRGGGKHGGRTTSNAPQESPNSRVEIAQARDEGQSAVGLKEAADRRAAQKGGLAGVIPNPKSGVAAIASRRAGLRYGLDVIAPNIEDNRNNTTRFAVIGDHTGTSTGRDKTSVMFELAHCPGALADAMGIFKRHQLNLTWIESFPMPGTPNEYMFFVEFVGHETDESAHKALSALEKKAVRVVVLGSYPVHKAEE